MEVISNANMLVGLIGKRIYPVVTIDLADRDEYGVRGSRVNIDTGKGYFIEAYIRNTNDNPVFQTVSYGAMISGNLTYEDVVKRLSFANAPVIKANSKVMLCLIDSRTKSVFPARVLSTGRLDLYNSRPLELEPFSIG